MRDDPEHPTPSGGLVPDVDSYTDPERLTDGTPDAFDEPVDEGGESEAPEERATPGESVYPGDTDFEQALEDDEEDRYGR